MYLKEINFIIQYSRHYSKACFRSLQILIWFFKKYLFEYNCFCVNTHQMHMGLKWPVFIPCVISIMAVCVFVESLKEM